MNHFSTEHTAERYAKGRPYFHEGTMDRISRFLQLDSRLGTALDVACGTGLSAKALLRIAHSIYATDSSEAMLKQAPVHPQIHYSLAAAERQPFSDAAFDLLTVCSGVHWFNIDRFLLEAKRLLKPGGWLVLYDNFFSSEMEGTPSFSSWYKAVYLQKFPAPARNDAYEWTNANLATKGFARIHDDRFKNTVEFTRDSLTLYLTTQSNISQAVKQKKYTYPEIENWLNAQLEPVFDTRTKTVHFGNWISYLQKAT